jgi:hypothetical protein
MSELFERIGENLAGRITGPFALRLLLQPTVAGILGVRAALQDARLNRSAYLWAIYSQPSHRRELILEGVKDAGRVFGVAVILDIVYQLMVLRFVYPGEALAVALLLAVVPYVIVRGPLNRVVRLWRRIRSTKPDRLSD